MHKSDRQLVNQAVRQDFTVFIHRVFQTVSPGTVYLPNWHINAMAHRLLECAEGTINRLAVTVPPRHLKSICASVALVAWILGHDPTRKIITVSYAQDLAEKFSRDFRAVVNSDWYQTAFPSMRPAKDTEMEFVTTRGGFRYATSVGGTLTGRGANLIIIDDPLKSADAMSKTVRENGNDWFKTTLFSRLNDKSTDSIIVVMQRLHVNDLVGYLLGHGGEDWVHLNLPAIAQEDEKVPIGDGLFHQRNIGDVLHPIRESRDVLDQIKAAMGSEVFSAQYLQRPVPEDGNMIKRQWLRFYDVSPAHGPNARIIQSWDTAMKPDQRNDPSVCTTWLDNSGVYYLIDVVRERLQYPDLKRLAGDLAASFRADVVIIEDKGSGTSLIQDLVRDGTLHPIAFKPEGDKVLRMHAGTARIEAGQVWLPKEAPWLDTFLSEILAFPGSGHDDQVDSLSQFLNWVGRCEKSFFEYDFGYGDPPEETIYLPYT